SPGVSIGFAIKKPLRFEPEWFFYLFHSYEYFLKSLLMMFGKVGKDLAVKQDIFLLEGADELRIRYAKLARAGIYLDIPELPVVGFLVLPVGEGVVAGMEQRILCLAFFRTPSMTKALGLLEDASPSF